MQQKIQSARRGSQSGKTADVGELPDVETGTLPVSHFADTSTENDGVQPDAGNGRITKDSCQRASTDQSRTSIAAGIAVLLIKFYQKAISPWLPCQCRFEPSCSHYAVDAYRKRGFWAGSILTAWRLMRCQPFGKSGYDPVPEKGFRAVISKQSNDD